MRVAYFDGRTGEGQAAGTGGRRRAQTGCGPEWRARAVAGKPKSRCHARGVAYEDGRTGGRAQAIPPQSGVMACIVYRPAVQNKQSESVLDKLWKNVDKNSDVSLTSVVRSNNGILSRIGLQHGLDLHHVAVAGFSHHAMAFTVRQLTYTFVPRHCTTNLSHVYTKRMCLSF